MRRLNAVPLSSAALLLFLWAGCGNQGSSPASPTPQLQLSSAPAPSPATMTANGRFTWTSIDGPRSLCRELTSQVGQSWPLLVGIRSDGQSVTLTLSEGPVDPLGDAPAVFGGSQSGETILASRIAPNGGMACPRDSSITPLVGGDLTATLSGREISGDYTEIYGTGADRETFHFHFVAAF
jgi:hypothetical protein